MREEWMNLRDPVFFVSTVTVIIAVGLHNSLVSLLRPSSSSVFIDVRLASCTAAETPVLLWAFPPSSLPVQPGCFRPSHISPYRTEQTLCRLAFFVLYLSFRRNSIHGDITRLDKDRRASTFPAPASSLPCSDFPVYVHWSIPLRAVKVSVPSLHLVTLPAHSIVVNIGHVSSLLSKITLVVYNLLLLECNSTISPKTMENRF
jgi:hypothetical protein